MTNGAKYLPDSFKKSTDSTNYKLLQLLHLAERDANADFNSIIEYRNIQNAYGKALDRYGEMVGISRSGATDEQYRLKIRGKLARMASDGTCNKIISLTADIIGAEPDTISVEEKDMSVAIHGMTLEALENTGCKSAEITSAIAETLSAGVSLEPPIYEGNLLVMGEVIEVEWSNGETYIVSIDADGNYQYPIEQTFIRPNPNYPTLQAAYALGQWYYQIHHGQGLPKGRQDRGLSGEADIPTTGYPYIQSNIGWFTKNTYEGGTLSLLSGDDE